MEDRWARFHGPACRWIEKVERKIRRLDHPDQGTFISICNAILFQFEAGADDQTVRHLIHALHSFAQAVGLDAADIASSDSVDEILEAIRPKRPRTR